jgi:hypothetical protein
VRCSQDATVAGTAAHIAPIKLGALSAQSATVAAGRGHRFTRAAAAFGASRERQRIGHEVPRARISGALSAQDATVSGTGTSSARTHPAASGGSGCDGSGLRQS